MRRNLLLPLIFLLILCSCHSSDDEFRRDACLLMESHDGVVVYKYAYDRHHRLTNITVSRPARMDEKYQIDYNSNGNVSRYSRLDYDNQVLNYFEYGYNLSNQITHKKIYSLHDGALHFRYTHHYEYSDIGRLVQEYNSRDSIFYEYSGPNSVTLTTNHLMLKTIELEYDDQPHPFSQLPGNFASVVQHFSLMDFDFTLPHNVISRSTFDSHGQLIDHMSHTYTKTYQYGHKGLPLMGNVIRPNGDVREQTFVYGCES
jgi:hypothetical protein